ncbi:MAG TPA: hypothetical protein VKB49_08355 [Candidatus Sulfotelmatobacter sp.]|nr:hypothetical protein [Candidatus Sulfotelmatobacter sp.]
MSTTFVSNSINRDLHSFLDQRRSDLRQLKKDLQSGDLTAARRDYQTLQSLGQSGPFADGGPFGAANREKNFEDIGAALDAGDLTGARRALLCLHQTFVPMNVNRHEVPSPSPAVPAKTPAPSPEQGNGVSVIA